MADIADIVDLERWPVGDLASPRTQALVAEARARLADPGYFTMPGFLRAEVLPAVAAEAQALLAEGHRQVHERDGGLRRSVPGLTRAALVCAGGDRMAPDSPLRRVYAWQPLTDFLGAVFGIAPYYRSADTMVGCMLTGYGPGDELGWHFDPNDGVVTLMVQKAGEGGVFEFAPAVRRDADDPATPIVDAVVEGRWPGTLREDQEAGTLALFNGHRAPHRVTPILSAPERIMLVMSYDSKPGQVFSDEIRRNFFGRTA